MVELRSERHRTVNIFSRLFENNFSRRALIQRASVGGLVMLGSAALSKRARAGQSCGRRLPQTIGQTVQPLPAGKGRSVIHTNCMPNHAVGPYFANDSVPQPTEMNLYLPVSPEVGESTTPVGDRMVGVAVNGVPFESVAPKYRDSDEWRYNVLAPGVRQWLGLDANNGHVYPNGQYHYVANPLGLLCGILDQYQKTPGGAVPMVQLGWAADGFPIYAELDFGPLVDEGTALAHTLFRSSYRLKSGRRPHGSPGGVFDGTFVQDYEYVQGSGDLDECNGRFGTTPEHPNGTYYYVVTRHFPFLPPAFRGTPDASFSTQTGPMSLPAAIEGYVGSSTPGSGEVPENPTPDAALLGLPEGLPCAQAPLVMDSGGYRYFLAIGSTDGRLYHSSIAIDSGEVVTAWRQVPRQLEFTTLRPDFTMLESDRFEVSIQSDVRKARLTITGSLSSGNIQFSSWRTAP